MGLRKILILSGSRADLPYLIPIAEGFQNRAAITIESLAAVIGGEDTPQAIAERAGRILSGGGKTLADNLPDLMIVLGDRWEIAAGCIAAVLASVPIAHLAAGDSTAGAYDDKFRAAIEGMATLKFPFTQQAYVRLRGDGYLAGCTSVTPPAEIASGNGTALLILHPETAGALPKETIEHASAVLESRGLTVKRIGANPDVGASAYPGESLPIDRFHTELAEASIIVGNSSAGIIEAPILGTPSVNIGRRQSGRPRASSIFDCGYTLDEIEDAVDSALAFGKRRVDSPYYRENAVEVIVEKCLEYLYHF